MIILHQHLLESKVANLRRLARALGINGRKKKSLLIRSILEELTSLAHGAWILNSTSMKRELWINQAIELDKCN